jgi:pantoate--beta-alanine ligase
VLALENIEEMREVVGLWRREGARVGLVPTMGALHDGHLSLVEAALRENERVMVSIFVNPTQFAPGEDYARYPRDTAADLEKLEAAGCHAAFVPTAETMFPDGFDTHVEVGALSRVLIGAHRPTHFRGVATVCAKLFHLVQPDTAYFGQKDYQQVVILKKMVADLNFPVGVRMAPIARSADGLALSSRNRYLSPAQRAEATALYRGLNTALAQFRAGERDPVRLTATVASEIAAQAPGFEIAYVVLADPHTLAPVEVAAPGQVLLVEVYLDAVRLYDNVILS